MRRFINGTHVEIKGVSNYTSELNILVHGLVDQASQFKDWQEIRFDKLDYVNLDTANGLTNIRVRTYAYSTTPEWDESQDLWVMNDCGDCDYLRLGVFILSGSNLYIDPSTFGIIRTEPEFSPEPKLIKLPEHNLFHFPKPQVDPYLQGWHDAMSALNDAVDIAPIKNEDAVEFIRGYMEGQRRNIQLRGE